MMEVVIGSITALLVFISTLFLFRNQIKLLGAINNESEMIGENLNHVASAIVGLSELLEEADQVIEEATTDIEVEAKEKISQPHLDNSEIKNTEWKDFY